MISKLYKMTNTQTTTNLRTRLEKFDFFYEMSCDNSKWNAGLKRRKINQN